MRGLSPAPAGGMIAPMGKTTKPPLRAEDFPLRVMGAGVYTSSGKGPILRACDFAMANEIVERLNREAEYVTIARMR